VSLALFLSFYLQLRDLSREVTQRHKYFKIHEYEKATLILILKLIPVPCIYIATYTSTSIHIQLYQSVIYKIICRSEMPSWQDDIHATLMGYEAITINGHL